MKALHERGIALLVVLWVLAILTVTAFSFAVLTRAETYGTLAFREGVQQKYLAEAGIERGILEIIYGSVNRGQTVTLEGREIWRADGTPHSVVLGGGGYTVRVFDESGKIPLNALNDASGIILKNLLLRRGVPPEEADAIVDAVLDWKDADDLHRLHGAESDYYQSLAKPYRARNADFEALEELILVRGVTPELLYGTGRTPGIIRFLTIHSGTSRINLASAPREVLLSLPGMDPEMADRLVAFRSSAVLRGQGELREILGAGYALMAPYVDLGPAGSSAVFSVEATGRPDGGEKGYSIVATVAFDGPHRYRYEYYKSPAGALP